ncbi:FG-GAP repeat protein [Enhygromyxa salina]|uniref:FG-GAP repeat protein n=1 Tax=Enhygromyxa salina TaxID=215803 RepID=A0A2S9XRQ5_9BACT|nr:hypothetical protein [Enhygromyxa salina]PRP95544.1 FG-GAP repeat protein [Enhygromyxa salina]
MSPKHSLLLLAALASFTVGACFNGLESEGLPCDDDSQCGPSLGCVNNYCGGSFLCADGSLVDALNACDSEFDCPDESDEDFELCFGGEGQAFTCEDGRMIPVELVCNDAPDCLDGGDESPSLCAGVGVNQCEASPDGELGYELGPSHDGVEMPTKVEAVQLVGPPLDDLLVASDNGAVIKIVSFNPVDGSTQDTLLNGPNSFDGRTVVAWELGDVNGDGQLDVVVATVGDSVAFYVFENLAPAEPAPFGAPAILPDALAPEIRSMKLGRLNGDASLDIVVIVDGAVMNGQIYAGLGDASAPPDDSYFAPVLTGTPALDYDTFFDAAMADIDGNGFDDLLVSGLVGGAAKIWIVERSGEDPVNWDEPVEMILPSPANEIALARFGPMAPNPDLAVLDSSSGRIRPFLNEDGVFKPGQAVELDGAQFSGLTLADMNCDGLTDFLFNVANPAEVRVMLGNGMGQLADDPIVFSSEGTPRGGLAVTQSDSDTTPDIASAIDGGPDLTPQVRLLQTEALLQ